MLQTEISGKYNSLLYFCFLSPVFLSPFVPWESVYSFNFKIWYRITSLQLIKLALFFPLSLLASHFPSLAWKTRENNACSAGYRITYDITVERRYSEGPSASLVYAIDLLLTSALWKLALIAVPLGPADRVPTHTYKDKTEQSSFQTPCLCDKFGILPTYSFSQAWGTPPGCPRFWPRKIDQMPT